uniref:Uncharacterized protein n=1 Tax=Leersia perrieri TaxID=77586 RepID=A0A0D9V6U4_9ORYZ
MAAEARTESPAAPPAPALPVAPAAAASPEKRVLTGDAGKEEERPEPKRRRACVAALDSVPCAAPPLADGGDGSSFSFPRARGGFVVLETTPRFGSFNPPAAVVGAKAAPPADGQGSPEEEDGVAAREEGDGEDGNSQLVGPDGQGHKT